MKGNNRFYRIKYEVVGGKRNDEIFIWSNSLTNAIKEFINTEIETYSIKVKYTEYAIVSIEVQK